MPTAEEVTVERQSTLASVFDSLIASNLALSLSVGRLVKLSWAIILLNIVLISVVIATLVWVAMRVHT